MGNDCSACMSKLEENKLEINDNGDSRSRISIKDKPLVNQSEINVSFGRVVDSCRLTAPRKKKLWISIKSSQNVKL